MGLFSKPKVDTTYQDFMMDEAARARAEETARQRRIDEGMRHIAAIFDGGVYSPNTSGYTPPPKNAGINDALAWAKGLFPKEEFTINDALAWSKDFFAGNPYVKPTDHARGTRKYDGMQPLLDQRRKAMEDYYLPQLDRQRSKATDDLTFALARAGLLNSTVAGDRQADLTDQFALEKGSVLSRIASDIANTKTRMNSNRASIEAGLRSSGDTSAAADAALRSAVTFREEVPEMNPLGHLFYGISEGIGSAKTGADIAATRQMLARSPFGKSGRVVGA